MYIKTYTKMKNLLKEFYNDDIITAMVPSITGASRVVGGGKENHIQKISNQYMNDIVYKIQREIFT